MKRWLRHKARGEDGLVEAVISRLKRQGLVNDTEFAAWWVEQRDKHRPKAAWVIARELRLKGIADAIIEQSVKIDRDSERGRAKEAAEAGGRRYRGLSKKDAREKLMAYLARRGFGWELVKAVVDEKVGRE